MDECRSAEPRTQDQNWNSLGDCKFRPLRCEAVSFWGLIVNAKPLLRYCSEEPRSFQSGPLGPGASRVCSSFWEEWQEWVSKFMSGDSLRPFYLSIWRDEGHCQN